MAGKSFQFRLITPAGKLIDAAATSATLPAHDGLIGILANRAPIVVKLGIGELKVDIAGDKDGHGGTRAFMVEDGFAQMADNKLTVLAARATSIETLSETDAQAELAAAEARKPADSADAQRITRDKSRARIKLRLARSASGKGI